MEWLWIEILFELNSNPGEDSNGRFWLRKTNLIEVEIQESEDAQQNPVLNANSEGGATPEQRNGDCSLISLFERGNLKGRKDTRGQGRNHKKEGCWMVLRSNGTRYAEDFPDGHCPGPLSLVVQPPSAC